MRSKSKEGVPWTEREDNIVRTVSPEVAAEKLGRSLESVNVRRKLLGLPEWKPRSGPASSGGEENRKPQG